MLRPAVAADLPLLLAIRDSAGADALSDPALITDDGVVRWIAAGAVSVWDEEGRIAGFAAAEDGAIHLSVDSNARDRGIGRALLAAALAVVEHAGHPAATVSLPAGSVAGRHYRAAGWTHAGASATGGFVLKKPF